MRTKLGTVLLASAVLLGGKAATQAQSPAAGQSARITALPTTDNRYSPLDQADDADEASEQPRLEWVDVSSQGWSHEVMGRVQADTIGWARQSDGVMGENYFEFRRLRIGIQGEGYGVYEYKVEVDFEPETLIRDNNNIILSRFGSVAMKDVYLGISELPVLGTVLFGHFKAPMSLEELTSSRYITFMERALPNIFVPGREVGIASYNVATNERRTFAIGFFFDSVSETEKELVDSNQGLSIVARRTWVPLYDEPSNGRYAVHLGLSGRYTHARDQRVRFADRPEIHEGVAAGRFFDTGFLDVQDWGALDFEFAAVWGRFSVQSEAIWTYLGSVDQSLFGAYAFASYFLTGEHRNYNPTRGTFEGITPHSNFWFVPGCCGRGAWEAAIRWSYLNGTRVGAGQLNDVTLGLNWYLNPKTVVMFEWIHAMASPSGFDADIAGMRVGWHW